MKQAHRRTWRDDIGWLPIGWLIAMAWKHRGYALEVVACLWMFAMVIAFFFYVLPLIAAGRGV